MFDAGICAALQSNFNDVGELNGPRRPLQQSGARERTAVLQRKPGNANGREAPFATCYGHKPQVHDEQNSHSKHSARYGSSLLSQCA